METQELNFAELDQISGGMKSTPGTKNDDVVDARGGPFIQPGGFRFTLDRNGKLSSLG